MAKNRSKSYNFCPNLSLPENRERIKEVGKEKFMAEYFEANFSVDSQAANSKAIDQLFVDIDKYPYRMQTEIIESILYSVDNEISAGVTNPSEAFNNVRESFEGQLEDFKKENKDGSLDRYIEIFEGVVENWDKFEKFSKDNLDKIGIKIAKEFKSKDAPKSKNLAEPIGEEDNQESDHFQETESNFRRDSYAEDFIFSRSTKDNASGRLKYALSRIPKLEISPTGKAEIATNFLGLPSYMGIDQVWSMLLTETAPYLETEILDALETKALTNPVIREVLNRLDQDTTGTLKNEFVTTFSNQQADFTTVTVRTGKDGKITRTRVFETNRRNASRTLLTNWAGNLVNTELVTEKDGVYTINTERAKGLAKVVDNLIALSGEKDEKYKARLNKLFESIGVQLSENTLNYMIAEGLILPSGKLISLDNFLIQRMKVILRRLSGTITSGESELLEDGELTLDNNNPYISETSSMNIIAETELAFNPFIYESSFRNGEGNSKYTYVKNTYLSKSFKKIRSNLQGFLAELGKSSYTSSGYWTKQLKENPSFKDHFKLSYLDTIRMDGRGDSSGVQFKDMSDREKDLTRILLFQNQGRSSNASVFMPIIPSDKSTIPLIQAVSFPVLKNGVRISEFSRETNRALMDIFTAEYSRIKDVFAEEELLDKKDLIEGYHQGWGRKFVIYDFLNDNPFLFNEDGTLKEVSTEDLLDHIFPMVEGFARNLVDEQVKIWEGQIDIEASSDPVYLKNLKARLNNPTSWDITAEYVINNFIASVSYTQLFAGDPALFGKRTLEASWVNFFKRAAKEIAPGMDGVWDSPTYRTLILEDPAVDSKHLKEYSEALGNKVGAYKGMELADAQEYVTLQEALDTLKAFAKLSTEVASAGERLLKHGNNPKDIALVLNAFNNVAIGPTKPVQVGIVNNPNLLVNRMYYIKSSAFPLIPALTKGLEIDKLRQFMEDAVDKDGNPAPIQRVAFKTAVKVGAPLELQEGFDADGNFNTSLDSTRAVTLNRDIFRIQQEVPNDIEESMINEGSQAKKLILGDLANDDILNMFGKEFKAGDVKQIFDELHAEKTNRGFAKLMKDFGVDSKTMVISDLSKFQEALLKEAVERNFGINDLYGLQLVTNPETGKQEFLIPLGFQNNSAKIESLLNSLITNRAIKQELPGFSLVQGSSAGFKRIVGDTDVTFKDSSIVWVGTPPDRLNYIRKSVDGKSLVEADILVPSWFKDKEGNLIDITKYMTKDGFLDTSRIPENLLNLFGIRIPTQGYNSMMVFKVRGFLPHYMGSLAIVPAEVVAQMGSDFDVDSMYFYRKEYTYDKESNKYKSIGYSRNKPISELSRAQINNYIFDIYFHRIKDPALLPKLLEPNGFGKLQELSEEIGSILGIGQQGGHALSVANQNEVHKANNAGKAGVGIFSLFSVFTKFAQDSELKLGFKTIKEISKSGTRDLKVLADPKLPVSPTQIIQYFQSAAVDNANEQILGNLNINSTNMDVVGFLALMGVSEEGIAYFTSHPTMREISKRLELLGDSLSEGFEADPVRAVFIQMYPGSPEAAISEYESLRDIYSPLSMDININIEELKKGLTKKAEDIEYDDPTAYTVLKNFVILKGLAGNIRNLMSFAAIDTKGVGQRYAYSNAVIESFYRTYSTAVDGMSPFDNVTKFLSSIPISTNMDILKKTKELYSQLFPYATDSYQSVLNNILENVGKNSIGLTGKQVSKIYDFLKGFVYAEASKQENIIEKRIELLFNTNEYTSLGNRFTNYFKTKKGGKRLLKDRLFIRPGKLKLDPVIISAFNTPGASSVDNNNIIAELYDMYYNGTAEEQALVRDLTEYYILTGGQLSPSSLGKFIPFDILESTKDFSKNLRDIQRGFQDTSSSTGKINLFGAVTQYYQAYPAEAFPIPLTRGVKEDIKAGTLTFSKYNPSLLVSRVTDFVAHEGFPEFASIYDSDAKIFRLYKHDSSNIVDGTYYRIPTIRNKDILELSPKAVVGSTLMLKQRAPKRIEVPLKPIAAPGVDNTKNDRSQEELINYTAEVRRDWIETNEDLMAGNMFNIEPLMDNLMLRDISASSVKLLNDLKLLARAKKIRVSYMMPDDFGYNFANGMFDEASNTVLLNLNLIASKSSKDEVLAEILAHEILHGLTVTELESNPNSLHAKNIIRLYNRYIREFTTKGDLTNFKAINQKIINNENVSEDERNFYRNNYDKLYPLINVREFVAAGMSNPFFRDTLKANNFWTVLFEQIKKLLGLNPALSTDYDFLMRSVEGLNTPPSSSYEVVDGIPKDAPFSINKDELHLRQRFVEQRNEFQKAFKTSIGKKISDATLKKFQDYVASNSKYNMLTISSWKGELRISRRYNNNFSVDSSGGLFTPIVPFQEGGDISPATMALMNAGMLSGSEHFDLNEEHNPEQKAIDASIKRLRNILDKFKSSGQASTNPVVQQKIDIITKEIQDLKAKGNYQYIMTGALKKMDQIQDALLNRDSPIPALNIEEYTRYLGFYKDIKKIITYDEAFKEENALLNKITDQALDLIDQLKEAKLETAVNFVRAELDIKADPQVILTSPIKDVSYAESEFQSGMVSSSKQVQLVASIIESAQIKSMVEFNEYRDMIKGVIEAYVKKYGGNYSQFLQKDSKGKLTGHLLGEYSQDYYDELKKRTNNKPALRKFLKENSTLEISEEAAELFKQDMDNIKQANPLWDVKGTQDYDNVNTFLHFNNPYLYLKRAKDGQPTNYMRGAKKYITRRPIDKYLSSEYAELMSRPDSDPAKALFELLQTEFRILARKYGNQSNFIPEFSKSFLDSFLTGDIKGAFGGLTEDVISSVFKTVSPNVRDSQVDLDGNPFNVIPVMHMQDTLNPEDKDYDLARVLLLAKKQEILNKNKQTVEPYLIMMKEIIKDLPGYNLNPQTGDILVDINGNPILNEAVSRNSRVNEQVNYITEAFLYNKSMKDSGAIKGAERKITTINSKGEEIETAQVLTLSAVGDTLNKITRAKGMMFNAFSGVANLLWGVVSNVMISANRTYFSEQEMLRALGFMLNSSILNSKNNKKFNVLFDKFHILKSKSDLEFGRLGVRTNKRIWGENDAYIFSEQGERFVQGQTVMAILMNKKVKDLEGNEHSIFDAHGPDGKWNTEKFGEDPFKDPKNRMKIITEISSAVADAHGDYDRDLKIKQNVLGRILMVFRTWIPQSLALRFGQEYEDLQGNIRKGRYRSLKVNHIFIAPLIKDIIAAYNTNEVDDTVDTRNLRALGMEASIAASLYALGMLLKGLMGEIDDEDKELFYLALNSTIRLQGDLTFYFNPYSFESTVREPAPAFKTIMDFIDLGESTLNWINGDDEYKTGHRKGRSKLYHNIVKQFPIISQPAKLENVMNMALDQ